MDQSVRPLRQGPAVRPIKKKKMTRFDIGTEVPVPINNPEFMALHRGQPVRHKSQRHLDMESSASIFLSFALTVNAAFSITLLTMARRLVRLLTTTLSGTASPTFRNIVTCRKISATTVKRRSTTTSAMVAMRAVMLVRQAQIISSVRDTCSDTRTSARLSAPTVSPHSLTTSVSAGRRAAMPPLACTTAMPTLVATRA